MKTLHIISASTLLFIILIFVSCSHSDNDSHKEGEHKPEMEHADEIELSEKQMKTVGIELGSFSFMTMGKRIAANGELKADPQYMAEITPIINGVIRNLAVREGQYVKATSVVATIESFEINNLVRNYTTSLSDLKLAENEYERQKKLSEQGAGIAKNLDRSRIEYESAKSMAESYKSQLMMAGISLEQTEKNNKFYASVKSPINGTVTKIYSKIGGEAGAGLPIMSIVDNSHIFALVRIYEKDLDKIRDGMTVQIKLTNGSKVLQGKVDEIIRSINPDSKTIDVRVDILDNKEDLIPGMAVNADINTEEIEATVLPEEAVVSIEGKEYIYIVAENELHDGETSFIFKPVEVVKGSSRNGFVEINPVQDLPKDVKIVTSKAFYIASMATEHGEHNH